MKLELLRIGLCGQKCHTRTEQNWNLHISVSADRRGWPTVENFKTTKRQFAHPAKWGGKKKLFPKLSH